MKCFIEMRRINLQVFLALMLTGLMSCGWTKTRESSSNVTQAGERNEGVQIRASSYNIRFAADADVTTGNGWDLRKQPVAQLIQRHGLDIVGTQEGNFTQMSELLALLPEYDYVGYPYAGRTSRNHTASIVYNKAQLEVVDHGVFWYSETPDVESIGWDATDTRICTWARMKHKLSGQEFYFFTSHFYWRLQTAKQNSGALMVQKIQEIVTDDIPIISTGDLNSLPNSPQMKDVLAVLRDAYHISETPRQGP